nr:squalene/phytoene synthase family protein [Sphingomonas sp. ID1715]
MPAIADPERALSLAYAPAAVRPALAALWALDEQLGATIARTETPAIAQMRLAWWHDALDTLAESRPSNPVLVALAQASQIDPKDLLPLIDGWEALLEPLPLADESLLLHAEARGAALFRAAGTLLLAERSAADTAGRLWALTDLAFRVSDRVTAERALALAPRQIGHLPGPLAMLATLAMRDVRRGLDRPRRQGSPLRLLRGVVAGLAGL